MNGRAAAILLSLAILALMAPPATAAVTPGQMNHFEFIATPRAQGIGGPFSATATVYFDTDPHATLIVYNLTLDLDVPGGLRLFPNEASSRHYSQVDLPPTVSLFVVAFSWNLTASALGNQTLGFRVSSDNAGGGNATATVLVREGIVLGKVAGPSGTPSYTDTLTFSVNVNSGFDHETVPLNVYLMVYQSNASIKPASANGTRLRLSSGETVSGAALPMNFVNGSYRFEVPGQPRGTLIYWVYAETPYSNATSAPARLLIKDPGISSAVAYGTLAVVVGIAGVGIGYLVLDAAGKRKPSGFIHNSPDRIRPAVMVLIIGALILGAAAVMGSVFGLWRWFGYV